LRRVYGWYFGVVLLDLNDGKKGRGRRGRDVLALIYLVGYQDQDQGPDQAKLAQTTAPVSKP